MMAMIKIEEHAQNRRSDAILKIQKNNGDDHNGLNDESEARHRCQKDLEE